MTNLKHILITGLAALCLLPSGSAFAACTDPAGPGVDWSGCDKSGASLTNTNLTGANLTGTSLRGVYLRGVYLTGANLTNANLTNADLTSATLYGAYLTGTILTGATFNAYDLRVARLDGVVGLTSAQLRAYAENNGWVNNLTACSGPCGPNLTRTSRNQVTPCYDKGNIHSMEIVSCYSQKDTAIRYLV